MNEKDTAPSAALTEFSGANPCASGVVNDDAGAVQPDCGSPQEAVISVQPASAEAKENCRNNVGSAHSENGKCDNEGSQTRDADTESCDRAQPAENKIAQPVSEEIFGSAPLDAEDNEEIFCQPIAAKTEEIFGDAPGEDTREIVSAGAQRIGIPLEEWEPDNAVTPGMVGEVERYIQGLFTKKGLDSASTAVSNALADMARKGVEGFRIANDLLGELVEKMSSVESFKVVPKPPMELEVEICSKKEQTFYVKQKVLPMVELTGVRFGKRVHFEAKVDTERKALRMTISDGITFFFNLGPLFGIQPVRVKGTGYLKRDDKGRLVMITTVRVPGLDVDVDITVPLGLFFGSPTTKP